MLGAVRALGEQRKLNGELPKRDVRIVITEERNPAPWEPAYAPSALFELEELGRKPYFNLAGVGRVRLTEIMVSHR